MNTWLKPLITFAVGIILGVGVMYLSGVRPQSNLASDGIPDVVGLSGKGLATLDDNKALDSAQLVVTLSGIIQEIQGSVIVLANGDSAPISVTIGDQTSITGEAKENVEVTVFKLQDLKQFEFIQVYGSLEGDIIKADNIIRFID